MNSTKRSAVDAQRRGPFLTFSNNARAPLTKRGKHPVHLPLRQPCIFNKATLEFLSRQKAREKPPGWPRITAIDVCAWCSENALFSVNDQRGRLGLFDLDSQRSHCVNRVHAIFAGKESVEGAKAIGERGHDHRTMRNALIARHCDFE